MRCPDSGILEFILSSAMVPRILDVHFAGLSKIPVSILRGVFYCLHSHISDFNRDEAVFKRKSLNCIIRRIWKHFMLHISLAISTTVLRQEQDILHNTSFQVQINSVSSILFRFLRGQFPHEDPTTITERSIQQDIGRILIHVY